MRPHRNGAQAGGLLFSGLSWLWLLPLVTATLTECKNVLGPSEVTLTAEPERLTVAPGERFAVSLHVLCDVAFAATVSIQYSAPFLDGEPPTSVSLPCVNPSSTPGYWEGSVTVEWRVRDDAATADRSIRFTTLERDASVSVNVVRADAPPPPPPPPPPAEATWQPLGGVVSIDEPSYSSGPALVVDAANRPLAAWVENERVVVRRWDGSAWQTLSPLPASAQAQGTPALQLAPDGAPVVAWTERRSGPGVGESTRVQVQRWDGTAWQALGASPVDSAEALTARSPALLTAGGQLLLAWAEETADEASGARVQVRRWDGSAWVPARAAGPLPAPGQPDQPALAALPDGRLALAWRNQLTGAVAVALGGDVWQSIGSFPAVNTDGLVLGHTPGEGLLLVVPPSPPASQFSVRRWTGTAWDTLGAPQGPEGTGAFVTQVALAVDGASPLLAWIQNTTSQRDFRVRRWDGSAWVPLGDPLPPLARSSNGTPFGLALAGGAWPVLATEASQFTGTGTSDMAIRVREFR